MKEISLHILDIAENGVNAGADRISIQITENLKKDMFTIIITDNGMGMDAETVAVVCDPFVTSRKTRKVGLGIPFFKNAAESCNGFLKINSQPGVGTTINAVFQHTHIDRMPLGDIESTLINLLIGYPNINWVFEYIVDGNKFVLDDKEIKDVLGDVPLSEPTVIHYLRQQIAEGIGAIRITE